MIDEPNIVSYTVKELLSEIRSKLDHLTGALDAKADRSDVAAVHQRIDHLDQRLDSVEREQEHQSRSKTETTEARRFKVPLQLSIFMAVLALMTLGIGILTLVK